MFIKILECNVNKCFLQLAKNNLEMLSPQN